MTSVGNFITALLAIPAVRLFFEDLFLRIFAELWSSSQDPQFREKFLDLSKQLGAAETEEAKRAILTQIRDLRSRR